MSSSPVTTVPSGSTMRREVKRPLSPVRNWVHATTILPLGSTLPNGESSRVSPPASLVTPNSIVFSSPRRVYLCDRPCALTYNQKSRVASAFDAVIQKSRKRQHREGSKSLCSRSPRFWIERPGLREPPLRVANASALYAEQREWIMGQMLPSCSMTKPRKPRLSSLIGEWRSGSACPLATTPRPQGARNELDHECSI